MSSLPSELQINCGNSGQSGQINQSGQIKKYGEITLILGCMFAGKSSELIRQIRRYRSIGLNVLVIKHQIDDRYNSCHLTTHDMEKIESINVSNLNEIHQNHTEMFRNSDLVVIEEGQFFSHIKDFVVESAEKYGKDIIVAGLDGNFKREPFLHGELIGLIPLADNVYKLHGFCQICKRKAIFTKSIMKDVSKEVVVGGKEKYIPVCRQHYLEDS